MCLWVSQRGLEEVSPAEGTAQPRCWARWCSPPPWAQGTAGGAALGSAAPPALCRTQGLLLQARPSPPLGVLRALVCSESCCNPASRFPQAHFPSLLPDREVGALGHVCAREADASLSRLQGKILFPMSGINRGLCSLLLGREWLEWPKGHRGAQPHRVPSASVQGSGAGSGHQPPLAGCF